MKFSLKISSRDASDRKSFLWKQALATGASCSLSLINGMTIGISSVMLPQLRDDSTIQYDPSHESWIASIVTLSMMVGSLCSGPILDQYGRKVAHIFLAIPSLVGWIIIACANSTSIILVGRFFTGISAGGSRPVNMVYIGEITDPRIRSIALFGPGIMTPLGIWISHLMGYYLGWNITSITFVVPSGLFLVAFLFLKESPLWLISQGKTNEGIETFRWFRGTDEKSEMELKTVLERHTEKPDVTAKEVLKVVCSKAFIKPMLILLVVILNVQQSGMNALSFYSQDVFAKVFSGNIDPFIMTMAMDCIRIVVCVVFCVIGSLVPRKLTYLVSTFGVTIFAAGLIVCFEVNIGFQHTLGQTNLLWMPVLCLVMFVIAASAVMCTGWTFVPELLPTSARGLGSGLNSTFARILLFVTVKILPDIMKKYDVTGLFGYFGMGTLICGVILSFTLPETNGKTLQSIEDGYNKEKVEQSAAK